MKKEKIWLGFGGIAFTSIAVACGYFGEITGNLVFIPIGVFTGVVGGGLLYMSYKLSISENGW